MSLAIQMHPSPNSEDPLRAHLPDAVIQCLETNEVHLGLINAARLDNDQISLISVSQLYSTDPLHTPLRGTCVKVSRFAANNKPLYHRHYCFTDQKLINLFHELQWNHDYRISPQAAVCSVM